MGKQANIVLDGTEMWKASNTITDLLDGTTIVLKQASDEAITFSVFQDAEQVKKAVDAFIKAFNSVIETIDKYSGAPEYDGVTLKKAAGDLFGDTTVQSVRFQLKQAIYQTLDGDFRYRSLTSIGMQMGNGTMKDMSKLSLNADMLYDALQTDPEAVSKLFTDPKGFGSILSRASQAQGGDFSGAIKGAIDFETNRIDDIGRRRTDLELRIKNKRNYYVQQFLDMEQKLAKIQSQGTALANQLNVLLNASSGSNN
jgi:flagellar hook-associated protein 2